MFNFFQKKPKPDTFPLPTLIAMQVFWTMFAKIFEAYERWNEKSLNEQEIAAFAFAAVHTFARAFHHMDGSPDENLFPARLSALTDAVVEDYSKKTLMPEAAFKRLCYERLERHSDLMITYLSDSEERKSEFAQMRYELAVRPYFVIGGKGDGHPLIGTDLVLLLQFCWKFAQADRVAGRQ